MISQKKFIDISDKFVCVRLDTYESLETQTQIRSLLGGSMQNTAFVMYAPDGKTKLTNGSRSPSRSFRSSGGMADLDTIISELDKIAAKYPDKSASPVKTLQDFDSFKQSLNIASADQRLLVYTVGSKTDLKGATQELARVSSHKDCLGKYHYDLVSAVDKGWNKLLGLEHAKRGIYIVHPGKFGLGGKVLSQLPITSKGLAIKQALDKANKTFIATEQRKHYAEHSKEGRSKGIKFDSNVPPGEDRDGDGKIDDRKDRGPSARGRGQR